MTTEHLDELVELSSSTNIETLHWTELKSIGATGNPFTVVPDKSMLAGKTVLRSIKCGTGNRKKVGYGTGKGTEQRFVNVIYDRAYVVAWIQRNLIRNGFSVRDCTALASEAYREGKSDEMP